MPANIDELIPSLVRWGSHNGIAALEQLAMGQWDKLITQNGRQMISSSVNGQSFTYSFAPGLDVSTIIAAADQAYRLTYALNETGALATYLTTPRMRRTSATFNTGSSF